MLLSEQSKTTVGFFVAALVVCSVVVGKRVRILLSECAFFDDVINKLTLNQHMIFNKNAKIKL